MKALKNIESGLWEKQCCKCTALYNCVSLEGFREFAFSRDIDTPDGLARVCKKCISDYNKQDKAKRNNMARAQRMRALYAHKEAARAAAIKKYGDKNFKCSVLNCEKDSENLHHINYNDYLAVIPLCRSHHADAHTIPSPINYTGS